MAKGTAHDLFLVGLRNAYALENQALSIMQPQINRLESYPEVLARLKAHSRETEGQIARLDKIFKRLDETPSTVKNTVTSLMGSMAALGHSVAGDEILKNTFANFAFENYEIAAYRSLIALAEAAGHNEFLAPLEENLGEEIAMANWIEENVSVVTLKYLQLSEAGQKAKV